MAGNKISEERKRGLLLAKNASIDQVERDLRRKQRAEQELNEDSKIRQEIQKFIIQKCKEGKSSEEILKRLYFVYGSQKYQSYQKYFEGWVNNFIRKAPIRDDGEER